MVRPSLVRSIALAAPLALALAAAPAANADLPPPDGTKFVGYSFTVANADASKDFVLLSYPCSGSNGVPMAEMVELGTMPVSVGRRGGGCPVFAIARADYDGWKKAHDKPKEDALDELFKSSKVHACTGGPSPSFSLPTSDPRNEISETLRVSKLDAKECVLVSADVAAPPATSTPTSTPARTSTSSGGSAAPDASASSDPPPPVNHGCGGCATATRPLGASGVAVLGLVAAAVWRRLQRRR